MKHPEGMILGTNWTTGCGETLLKAKRMTSFNKSNETQDVSQTSCGRALKLQNAWLSVQSEMK